MSLRLVFRSVAQVEFDHAARWYEDQRRGLGADFVSEVQLVLDTIANHPAQFPLADGDVRGAWVSRFPYCIYYRVKPDRAVIIAVFHTSRAPSLWKGRK